MKNKKITALTMATAILGSGVPGVVCADNTITTTKISTKVGVKTLEQPALRATTTKTLDYAVKNGVRGVVITKVKLIPEGVNASEKEYNTIDSIEKLPFRYENGSFEQGTTIGKITRFEFTDLGRKKVATENVGSYKVFEEVGHTKADNIIVKTNQDRVTYDKTNGKFSIEDKKLNELDDLDEFEFQQGDVVKVAKFDSGEEKWNITDKESVSVSSNTVSVNVLDLQAENRVYKLDLDSKISDSSLKKIDPNKDAIINVELPTGVKTDNLKEINVKLDDIACRVKTNKKVTMNIKAKQSNSSSKTLYSWVIEGKESSNGNNPKQANLAMEVDNDVRNHKITIKAQNLTNVSATAIAKVNLSTELKEYNSSKILGVRLDGVNRTLNSDVIDLNKSDLEKLNGKDTYLQVYATTENKPEEKPKPEDDKVVLKDINNHWAKYEIQRFIDKGHINGYGDKTFKPDNNITRAEFIKVVNSVFGLKEKATENFTDVSSGQWYYNDVCIAVKAGYINGYEDKTFRPNQPISREEAAAIVANLKNVKGDGKLQFRDSNQVSSWAKQAVDAVSDNNLMGGYQDNTFKPKNKITRAEAVATLSRVK